MATKALAHKPTGSLTANATAEPKTKAPPLSTSQRAQIYALYVIKCVPQQEVAATLGITYRTVNQYIWRKGLTAERDARIKQAEMRMLDKATSQTDKWLDSVATQSEDLTQDMLQAMRDELQGDSDFKAKNVASYSQAAKNVFGMVKDARGIGTQGPQGPNIGVANFYLSAPPSKAEPRNVTPTATGEQPATDVT